MTPLAQTLTTFWVRRIYEFARGPIRTTFDPCESENLTWVDLSDLNQSEREYDRLRDPSDVHGAMMHVTGVTNGIGTSRGDRRWAEVQLADGTPYTRGILAETDEVAVRKVAYRRRVLGVSERDRGLPYARLIAATGEALILNKPRERTHHGHGGNRHFEGVAIDGFFQHKEIPEDILRLAKWGLRDLYLERMGNPLYLNYTKITAHRCYHRNRGADPGARVWRQVSLPVVRELDLEIHDVAVDGGRMIPASWA